MAFSNFSSFEKTYLWTFYVKWFDNFWTWLIDGVLEHFSLLIAWVLPLTATWGRHPWLSEARGAPAPASPTVQPTQPRGRTQDPETQRGNLVGADCGYTVYKMYYKRYPGNKMYWISKIRITGILCCHCKSTKNIDKMEHIVKIDLSYKYSQPGHIVLYLITTPKKGRVALFSSCPQRRPPSTPELFSKTEVPILKEVWGWNCRTVPENKSTPECPREFSICSPKWIFIGVGIIINEIWSIFGILHFLQKGFRSYLFEANSNLNFAEIILEFIRRFYIFFCLFFSQQLMLLPRSIVTDPPDRLFRRSIQSLPPSARPFGWILRPFIRFLQDSTQRACSASVFLHKWFFRKHDLLMMVTCV